jgi:hypothetical protein
MPDQFVVGCDFPAANTAPHQVFLAKASIGSLGAEIVDLHKVDSHKLPQELAQTQSLSALGIDFPFSLPGDFLRFVAEKREVPQFQSWQEVIETLVFIDFAAFQKLVEDFGAEPKRFADQAQGKLGQSLLAKGNSVLLQTAFQGMRMLASLDPKRFSILPLQSPQKGTCSVLETSPRSMLESLGLPTSGYRGKDSNKQKSLELRREILTGILELRERKGSEYAKFPRLLMDKKLVHTACDTEQALDAVISCYSACLWVMAPALFNDPFDVDNEDVLLEGWIYVPNKVAVGQTSR